MNPFLVIVTFTVILAIVIYWLQGRQTKVVEKEIMKVTPKKRISVIKKADWVADEEAEPTTEVVSEPAPAPDPEPKSLEKPVSEPTPEPEQEEEPDPELVVADIAELEGVGPKYQLLLKAAGIPSISVIAEFDPEELLKKLVEVNESEEITKRNPTMYVVERWIEAAKSR
ncbi:DUF4332 domain-containing protein [Candidatus Bathyarchaeota archaeon]|nr:DUF4332 domain-containing protein [Candidatus Bathyarchaeota archaeon]